MEVPTDISPEDFWPHRIAESLRLLDHFIGTHESHTANFISAVSEAFHTNGEEIAIFRILETHIRRGTVSEEIILATLGRLDTLRLEVQEKMKLAISTSTSTSTTSTSKEDN